MNRFRGNYLLLVAAILVPAAIHASSGTEGAAFLDIPVGARPAAMGAAYTALADDAYAATWNPGALGHVKSTQLSAQHLSYLDTMHYEYVSLALPFKRSGLGASIQYLGSGNIAGRNEFDEPTGDFSNFYASYNLSYGRLINDVFSMGLTGKMIHAKLDDVSASAFAADFGGMLKPSQKVSIGATLTNVGSKLKFIESGDPLPMAFHLGASYRPTNQWLISTEGVYRKSGLASFHTGLEWHPIAMLSLRSGYRTDTLKELSPLAGLTAGLGLNMWGHELAYAWLPYGDLGTTHYVSLVLKFGEAQEAKRNLIRYQSIKKHRTVRHQTNTSNDVDPEYMQLMELLNDSNERTAQRANDTDKL